MVVRTVTVVAEAESRYGEKLKVSVMVPREYCSDGEKLSRQLDSWLENALCLEAEAIADDILTRAVDYYNAKSALCAAKVDDRIQYTTTFEKERKRY